MYRFRVCIIVLTCVLLGRWCSTLFVEVSCRQCMFYNLLGADRTAHTQADYPYFFYTYLWDGCLHILHSSMLWYSTFWYGHNLGIVDCSIILFLRPDSTTVLVPNRWESSYIFLLMSFGSWSTTLVVVFFVFQLDMLFTLRIIS